MANTTRREFLKNTAAAAGVVAALGVSAKPALAAKRSATDWVTLGKSGVEVTRLALGTGTMGGKIQRDLGQVEFTKLVRHAYDRGIRFFETAEGYDQMHQYLGEALKGIPRDSYRLMTKMRWAEKKDVRATVDRYRKELHSDYFDILLIHNVSIPGWADELKWQRDAYSELKEKQVIRAKGASIHGLLALRDIPTVDWLDVSLNRINHKGVRMDNLRNRYRDDGDVPEVVAHLKQVHANGTGVIGMKVMGEGLFKTPEEREESIKFVLNGGYVDAFTIGFKSTAEVDEAIERIDRNLNT